MVSRTADAIFSPEDKYVLLQGEYARLKRALNRIGDDLDYYRERCIFLQSENERLRESLQEGITPGELV